MTRRTISLWTVAAVATSSAIFSALMPGATTVRAQTGFGPAYVVVELMVEDNAGFAEYAEKASPTVSQYGGSFIVLAADPRPIEGSAPEGFVTILKFDSLEAAQAWLESPEYSAVKNIRHRTSQTRQYLVQGVGR